MKEFNYKDHEWYGDFIKEQPDGDYQSFDEYLGKRINEEINAGLTKYAKRNETFLSEHNHLVTYRMVCEYMQKPIWGSREEMGDAKFDSSMNISGTFNSLTHFCFSQPVFREADALYYLNKISCNLKILLSDAPAQ